MAVLANFLIVALGGAIGSALRYGFSLLLGPLAPGFPAGTFCANLAGSLVIGFVTELAGIKAGFHPQLRLLFATGFCGGLTTLSSYLFELNGYLRDRELLLGLLYGAGTLVLSFAALWGGMILCRLVFLRT
jgi:CrcB protein